MRPRVRRPVSAAPGRWTRASCRRVESGESQGIRNARGRLVTVEDGVDSAKPGGRLLLTVLAGLAEEELEQRRNGWATARRQALKRGVHVGPSQAGIASSAFAGRAERPARNQG
jgi:DNA invertase Pin-like site-specific DNA recombinase